VLRLVGLSDRGGAVIHILGDDLAVLLDLVDDGLLVDLCLHLLLGGAQLLHILSEEADGYDVVVVPPVIV